MLMDFRCISINADECGRAETDEHLETNVKGIYAIGSVVKVLADATTNEILDILLHGNLEPSAEDIARMSHAHPTYAEAMKEACLATTENRAMHV